MDSSKRFGLVSAALMAFVIFAVIVCGCTGNEEKNLSGKAPLQTEIKTLTVTGSTTVLPVGQAAAESYMADNPNADIQLSGGGSSVGVQAVGEGTADIGMASRELKDSEKEKYPDLVQHVIAKDGIAIIVHKDNPVLEITTETARKIYKGDITNWKDAGGKDMAIVVVGRDSSSGTREFFSESVMNKEDYVLTQLEKNSNGAVKQTVAQTPGAIGYVSMGYLDSTVKGLLIDNVEPTVDNVLNGRYPVARGLNMFTKGEPKGISKDYLDFLLSPKGQAIVTEEGYVNVA
ncbi:MAG: phosphate ABC transporter substrate-binding protein [Methanomicrobium sp.]|nr:phosphate ABC transporter substrate-binding protein [Methanomicrobium sp.]MDD4299183.1 phosphate ABC transporter substrate-binding protein [Methanomicrobium sp.]